MTNLPQIAYASDLTFQVLSAAVSFMKSREADVTEREYIRAHRDVLVKALDNQKDCILAYFDHRFTERREALGEFYDLLHSAAESGDTSQLQAIIDRHPRHHQR